MKFVEGTERLSISQLKALPQWPRMLEARKATLIIDSGTVHEIDLTTDVTPGNGLRPWFLCPVCDSRRKHLFMIGGELKCRRCGKLIYYIQRLPDSAFRRDVAVPLLRQRTDHGAALR